MLLCGKEELYFFLNEKNHLLNNSFLRWFEMLDLLCNKW